MSIEITQEQRHVLTCIYTCCTCMFKRYNVCTHVCTLCYKYMYMYNLWVYTHVYMYIVSSLIMSSLFHSSPSVTVSLVSIKGTDCRVMELGQVADKTGGQVSATPAGGGRQGHSARVIHHPFWSTISSSKSLFSSCFFISIASVSV